MEHDNTPRLWTYLGVALVSMAALANEVILTRIFSVTLWYHFAFSVISLALLGSGAAGVWLHLAGHRLERLPARQVLAWLSAGFAVALLAAFKLYTLIPLSMSDLRGTLSLQPLGNLALAYLVLTVPYLLVGATLAFAIQQYQAHAGRIYFADLTGAGLGCLVSVAALNRFGGAGAVLAVALVAALGSAAFALATWQHERAVSLQARPATLVPSLLVALAMGGGTIAQARTPWLDLPDRNAYLGREPVYEAWNAFSRITVYEDTQVLPFSWGLSPVFIDRIDQGDAVGDPNRYLVLIDEKAGTPIIQYRGITGEPWFEYLRWDLTALPYYVREKPSVFIIGPGGGRDVVTAYEFDARQITGVELNPLIVDLVQNRFADYIGHIYQSPKVVIVVDDARTFLARSHDQYDIIQASLIDTLAASSAGAFALSENGIYTREAFLTYYDHLTPEGVVNFSRWYFPAGPAETLRLVALGLDAWQRAGVDDPTQHIIVVANLNMRMVPNEGLAGMLLKKTPFTPEEIAAVHGLAEEMGFVVLYAPGHPAPNPVSDLITAHDYWQAIRDYPLDISPPTDNRPFYFNVVRFTDLNEPQYRGSVLYNFGVQAAGLLIATFVVIALLTIAMIVIPVAVARGSAMRRARRHALIYVLYFGALGVAFMLVEIPMVQRLTIYLGSPTYSLVVVLFSLLVFSGLGSFATQHIPAERIVHSLRLSLIVLLAAMAIYVAGLPLLLRATQGWSLEARIGLAVMVLAPAGLLMGRPFPLAMRYVGSRGQQELLPWVWAINSALSVLGSVSTVILAIHFGFTTVFVAGMVGYAVALIAVGGFGQLQRQPQAA